MPNNPPPTLLLIEADAETAFQVRDTLHEYFRADSLMHCTTLTQARMLDLNQFDLLLTDIELPDGTGLEVLEHCLSRRPDLPVVILAAAGVHDVAAQAIRKGAYDYVVKAGNYLFALPLIIEKTLATRQIKQENIRLQSQLQQTLEDARTANKELEQANQKLETMASTDPLTGLANRRVFNQTLERSFATCSRYGHDLACIMIDVDGFKALNDALGHQEGDLMLLRLARVLEANCRRSDVAGRYGGDEFVIFLPETDLETARHVAKRIFDEFEAFMKSYNVGKPSPAAVSLSMGLACLRESKPVNPQQLVAFADHALYRAKRAGKTRIMVYSSEPSSTTRSPTAPADSSRT